MRRDPAVKQNSQVFGEIFRTDLRHVTIECGDLFFTAATGRVASGASQLPQNHNPERKIIVNTYADTENTTVQSGRLKDQPITERPRERLISCGPGALSPAELLGIQRPTLYNKLKRYAIEL